MLFQSATNRPLLLRVLCDSVEKAAENASAPSENSPQGRQQLCGQTDFSMTPKHEHFRVDTAPFLFTQVESPRGILCTGFFLMRSSWFALFTVRHLIVMQEYGLARSDEEAFADFTKGWRAMGLRRIV
jgi:hypothetical protein